MSQFSSPRHGRRAGHFALRAVALAILASAPLAPAANIAPQGSAILGVNDAIDSDAGAPRIHAGAAGSINDANTATRVDNHFAGNTDPVSFVGILWPAARADAAQTLTLTMATFSDGGWFGTPNQSPPPGGALATEHLVEPTIQVTSDGGSTWSAVTHTSDYLASFQGHTIGGGGNPNPTSRTATFTLDAVQTGIDGIRIIGTNGGSAGGDANGFIGVFELAVDGVPANDTDTDGMDDAWEESHGLIVGTNDAGDDADSDGLANLQEYENGTDPNEPDTDSDGLNDFDEVVTYQSDPNVQDSDGDGLGDGDEVNTHGSNPTTIDSDGDGLSDGNEVNVHLSDPTLADSDGDDFEDGVEVAFGGDPVDPNAFPANVALAGTGRIGTNDAVDTDAGTLHANAGAQESVNDGNLFTRVDTFNGGSPEAASFVGVIWPNPRSIPLVRLELVMATFTDGGWFGPNGFGPGAGGMLTDAYLVEPTVQISSDGGAAWTTVAHTSNYLSAMNGHGIGGGGNPNPSRTPRLSFDFDAPPSGIDGVRIIGPEGGTASAGFIGVFELVVIDQRFADDPDLDGLLTADEINTHLTDPNNPDTDGDGLLDGAEVLQHGSNPLLVDTDNDRFTDRHEVLYATDPANPDQFPSNFALLGSAVTGTNDAVDSDSGTPHANAGTPGNANDGDPTTRVDTFNPTGSGTASFVGVLWPTPLAEPITRLELTLATFFDGGWFGPNNLGPGAGGVLTAETYLLEPVVQITTDGSVSWQTVGHVSDYLDVFAGHSLPAVAFGAPTSATATFNLLFPQAGIDGIRIIGSDGGTASSGFLGIFELEAISDVSSDADSDFDGQSDLAEAIAGTDPLDPTDFFRIVSVEWAAGTVTLTWTSVPGRVYDIESAQTSLGSFATFLTEYNAEAAPSETTSITFPLPDPPPPHVSYRVTVSAAE